MPSWSGISAAAELRIGPAQPKEGGRPSATGGKPSGRAGVPPPRRAAWTVATECRTPCPGRFQAAAQPVPCSADKRNYQAYTVPDRFTAPLNKVAIIVQAIQMSCRLGARSGTAGGRSADAARARHPGATASGGAINGPLRQPPPVRRAGVLGCGSTLGGVGRAGARRLDQAILDPIIGSLLLTSADLLARDVQGLPSAIKRIAGEHHSVGVIASSECHSAGFKPANGGC